jgi:hypothetical protein
MILASFVFMRRKFFVFYATNPSHLKEGFHNFSFSEGLSEEVESWGVVRVKIGEGEIPSWLKGVA